MKIVATKSMIYNTRRLLPGDQFEAKDSDAKLLIGIKKAVAAIDRKPGKIAPPSAKLVAKAANVTPTPSPAASTAVPERAVADADLDKLRTHAETLGITVDKRWSAKTLQAEIDAKPKA